MKIAVVGGHLNPALCVIENLPPDVRVIFIGRKYALEGDSALSLEYQKISSLNIPFINLNTGRLQRKFTSRTIPSLIKLPFGFIDSLRILHKHKPDALVCFGGYLQIPLCLAASILRIPIIIHEQTLKAGLANKLMSPLARKICVSWTPSLKYFPSFKTVLTGLPLRKSFMTQKPKSAGDPKTIYVTGGSLGAHALNILIEGCLARLLENFQVTHQTGAAVEYNDFERLSRLRDSFPPEIRKKYKIFKFIDPEETAQEMNKADIVISRSGINTIAELMYLRKPSILIPLPYGQTNEQLTNARFFEKTETGIVLEQKNLTPEILYSQIIKLTAKLKRQGSYIYETKDIQKNSSEKLVKIIIQTASQKKSAQTS